MQNLIQMLLQQWGRTAVRQVINRDALLLTTAAMMTMLLVGCSDSSSSNVNSPVVEFLDGPMVPVGDGNSESHPGAIYIQETDNPVRDQFDLHSYKTTSDQDQIEALVYVQSGATTNTPAFWIYVDTSDDPKVILENALVSANYVDNIKGSGMGSELNIPEIGQVKLESYELYSGYNDSTYHQFDDSVFNMAVTLQLSKEAGSEKFYTQGEIVGTNGKLADLQLTKYNPVDGENEGFIYEGVLEDGSASIWVLVVDTEFAFSKTEFSGQVTLPSGTQINTDADGWQPWHQSSFEQSISSSDEIDPGNTTDTTGAGNFQEALGDITLSPEVIDSAIATDTGNSEGAVGESIKLTDNLVPKDVGDLFFSTYCELKSYNKFLVIHNPSSAQKQLKDYEIKIYFNGNTETPTIISFDSNHVIEPNDSFLVANSDAHQDIVNIADFHTDELKFNGDDAVALVPNDCNDVGCFLDKIGQVGVDPGFAFEIGSVPNATKDHCLDRKDISDDSYVYTVTSWDDIGSIESLIAGI